MNTRTWTRGVAVGVMLALTVAACGGSDDESSSSTTAKSGGAPAATAGFDGTTIHLGVITPTGGPVAVIGNPLTAGNKAYFDYVNEELGGIAGKYPVVLDIHDSGYDPTKAKQEYDAAKGGTVMIAQLLGTPIVNSILAQLVKDDVVAAPASLDSNWVREPNLLPIGGPYQTQAMNALNWYVTDGDGEGKKVCSLASDDPYGEAGQSGLEFAAEKLDIDLGPKVSFPAPPAVAGDFSSQIGQLDSAGCEMVFLVSTPSSTGPIMTKAAQTPGFDVQWIGQSPTWLGALGASALAPYLQANFLVAGEGPNYGDATVKGMAELIRIKEKYAPTQAADVYFNFGYIEAKSVHALLEKAVELGDLSHAGILKASEELGKVSFDGLTGDYTYGKADDRVPPRKSTIFKVDPASPTGLTAVAQDIEAPFVKDYEYARSGD